MYCRTKQIGSQLKHAELINKKDTSLYR